MRDGSTAAGGVDDGTVELARRIAQDVSVLADRFARAADGAGTATGRDRSGRVEVTIDRHGAVQQVRLDPSWRTKVAPRDLGEAVLAAAEDAGLAWLERWAVRLALAVEGGAEGSGDVSASAVEITGRAARTVAPTTPAGVLAALADVDAAAAVLAARAAPAARTTAAGRAPGGQVEVVVDGTGAVVSVRIDPRWAASASASVIARRVVDAARRAGAAAVRPVVPQVTGWKPVTSVGAAQGVA